MPIAPAPLAFQFHDIAGVEIHSPAPFVHAFFQEEYGYHSIPGNQLPEKLPRVSLDFRLDPAVPPGFTRHVHKLMARWAYRVALEPGRVDLQVYGNRTAVPMVHHMLVHPSLRWLASAQAGTLLLHAGAVAKNGRSVIFTGRGGAGKTTTTSLVLASGEDWQLHADDYVFLRPGPQSLAYLTRSHLYRDLLKWVPEVSSRLTAGQRLRLQFFGRLRQYSGERVKWPVRLGPQRLWPGRKIADRAVPTAILLLERADVALPGLIRLDDLDEVAADLLEMNFGEARHFLSLLTKAGKLDQVWLASWKQAEHDLLAQLLTEIPAYRLVLPFRQTAGDVKMTLLPVIQNLVNS